MSENKKKSRNRVYDKSRTERNKRSNLKREISELEGKLRRAKAKNTARARHLAEVIADKKDALLARIKAS